jgi:hypothetical protein
MGKTLRLAALKIIHKLRKGTNHEKINVTKLPYAGCTARGSAGNARTC